MWHPKVKNKLISSGPKYLVPNMFDVYIYLTHLFNFIDDL